MDEKRELATNRLLEIIRGGPEGEKPPAPPPAQPESKQEAPAVAPAQVQKPPVRSTPSQTQLPAGSTQFKATPQAASETKAKTPPPPETPGRRPGMGLLDKVLSKQPPPPKVIAPTSSSPTQVISATIATLTPPAEDQASGQKRSPKETEKPPAVEPTPDDADIPDALLPLTKRIARKLKPSTASKKFQTEPAKKPADLPASAAKKSKKPLALLGARILAIDIGTAGVKVVELVKHGAHFVIANLESRTIPIAMRKNAASLPVLQSKLLREMLPASRLRGAVIHLVLPDKMTYARTVNIPGGAAKELVNAIKFQIKKDLPFQLDVCEVAYRGFDPKIAGKQEIEILAVDRRAIEPLVKMIEEIEALPSVITASASCASLLAKDYTGIASGPGAVVFVDIGAGHTTVSIVENEKLILARTVNTGGDDFTTALTGAPIGRDGEELTDTQAEKYKLDVGLPAERDPGMMNVAIRTRPIAERISTEINRSLDVYRRDKSGGEIKKMILCGGGALMKRLPEFLSENVGVDIVMGSPVSRLTLSGHSEQLEQAATESGCLFLPALAVALGDGKDLNLLPVDVVHKLRLKKARGVIAPAVMGFMAVLVGLYGLALKSKASIEREYERTRSELRELDLRRGDYIAAATKNLTLTDELKNRQADYDSIRIGEPDIPRYLKALSNLVPENVYLEGMATKFLTETDEELAAAEAEKEEEGLTGGVDLQAMLVNFTKSFGDPLSAQNNAKTQAPPVKRPVFGRVIELNGTIYPHGTLTDVQLVDFVFNLENSGHFREVAVDSVATTSDGRIKFRVICGM